MSLFSLSLLLFLFWPKVNFMIRINVSRQLRTLPKTFMWWASHLVQQNDVQQTCCLIVCLLLQASPHTDLPGQPTSSYSYHSLGWEELSKENNQKPELWITGVTVHWVQTAVIPHHQEKPSGCHPESPLQWRSQDNPRQHIHRINPVSVHHIPIQDSPLHGLMGQGGKQNIIRTFGTISMGSAVCKTPSLSCPLPRDPNNTLEII